ncbi:MAG TPA: EAL domain-containing protein [Rhodocyclaceae bacterium]|nr:EAL domain-containing protein [Rhodocyclaceae bacterium]
MPLRPASAVSAPANRSRPGGPSITRAAFLIRLALGAGAVILAVVLLTGLALYQNLGHYRERAVTSAQNMARLLEQFVSSAIEKNGVALYSVAHEVEEQLAEGSIDADAINVHIAGVFSQLTFIDGMGVADSDGIVQCGIRVVPSARASVADRDYFIRLRDDPRAGVVVSEPVQGRVSGRWLINLARRVNHPDGSFAGVVYAGITLERLVKTFSTLDVGSNGIVTLRDGQFRLIARYPELPDGPNVGRPTLSPELRQLVEAGRENGTYTVASVIDRIERTNSYRRIPGYPLYVTVGLATDDYLATWRGEASKATTLALLSVLGTLLASWLVYRAWLRRNSAVRALAEQEEKFRALVESSSDWIWEVDQEWRFTYSSPGVRELLGYEPGEVLGKALYDLLPAAEAQALRARLQERPAWGAPFSRLEKTVCRRDGGEAVLESSGVAILDAEGNFRGCRGISRDITERKAREAELGLAASVFSNTLEGVLVTDSRATILSVNPAFTAITGYSAEEAVGKKPSLLRSDHHGPEFYREMWANLTRDGHWSGEIWNRRKGGEAYLEWLNISAVPAPDGQPARYVGVFSDITELRRKDEDIRHLAFHDPLTNLPNRALLLDRLEHGITVARREGTRLAVMFVDLDRFKAINDSLGHDVGDGLLQEVAERLKACVRQSDTVARMGGDEFVILLEPAGELESYASLAGKIIEALSRPATVHGNAIQVGASVGIACFPDDGATSVDLMKHADAAMYAAKTAGRNTYRFFQGAMTERAGQRLKLEMELRRAASNGELELFYQPQVDLESNLPCGVEALLRWRHPEHGLLPPVDFIPVAEETGLICELGDWVLEEACRQWAQWQAEGCGVDRVAINVSAKQIQQGDLAERIAGLSRHYGIPASCLEVELTEGVIMADPEKAAGIFSSLRGLGVTVAMDDFGTGYSSLAYLRRLPIDILKIDRSFVLNAHQSEEDAEIVRTILALARALKLSVVAEGVETDRQAAFLRACGCAVGQGYLYARPAPAADVAEWLRRHGSAAGRQASAAGGRD